MIAVGVCAGLAALAAALSFVAVRRWAEAVAARDEPLVSRVHRLRRRGAALTLGSLVTGGALGGISVGATSGERAGGERAAGIVVAVFCYVLPLLATARAVRVPYARLRDVPVTIDGRGRRIAVTIAVSAVAIAIVVGGAVLAPRGRDGHLAGFAAAYALVLVLQALLSPLIVRATGLRPLPSEVAARLETLADDMGVRVRGFGVIPSRRQRIANAVQVGVLPGFQYVLLTEYLLESMTPAEIDAVTAHELGHVRGRHLLLRLGVVLPLWAGMEALFALAHGRAPWSLALVGLPVALFATQATLSIRLERRADRAAQRQLGGAHLASALTRLGEVNHIPQQTGWLWNMTHAHPGLGERIAYLSAGQNQPTAPSGRTVAPG